MSRPLLVTNMLPNMMANNYSIGGEQSGHIIFSRYAATGDGITYFSYGHGSMRR